jgi:hypothetical protein
MAAAVGQRRVVHVGCDAATECSRATGVSPGYSFYGRTEEGVFVTVLK